MAEEAKVVFKGVNQDLLDKIRGLEKENEKLTASLRKQGEVAKKTYDEEREGRKLANEEQRKAAQIIKSVETAEERYEQTVKDVNAALKKKNITQDQANRKLRQAKKELAGNKAAGSALTGVFAGLIPTTLGLAAAFGKATTEQSRLRKETEQTIKKVDRLTRAFQVQAGLNNLQAKDARVAILKTARANAVDEETAFGAATQLVSSGFANPEKTGTLDAFLKIVASSNQAGRDPTALVQGAGQFLTAFGLDKTGGNLLDLGVRSRGLFAETDFQVGDLSPFAQSAGTFAAAGVSLEDTLSANAILREQMAASEASTQGRNVVGSFQTFAADSGRTAVLRDQLGIEPAMVDLVGETLPAALRKLKGAIEALPKEEQAPVLTKLFGRENLRGAQALLGGIDKFQTFAGLQRDQAGFVAGVRANQSGINASAKRIAVDRTLLELRDEEKATVRSVAESQLANEDLENFAASGLVGDVAFGTGTLIRDALTFTDLASPETFLSPEGRRNVASSQQSNFAVGDLQNALGQNAEQARENVAATQENNQFMRDMTAALQENTAAMTQPRPAAMTPQHPAAGLGI